MYAVLWRMKLETRELAACNTLEKSYSISMISLPAGIGRGARRAGAGITGPHSIDESPSSPSEESVDGALRRRRGGSGGASTHRATTGARAAAASAGD